MHLLRGNEHAEVQLRHQAANTRLGLLSPHCACSRRGSFCWKVSLMSALVTTTKKTKMVTTL